MVQNTAPGTNLQNSQVDILIPLPDHDFDPTEAAIPWQILNSRGWRIAFSTEHGDVAEAYEVRLKGPLPGLISASDRVKAAYKEMTLQHSFQHPLPFAEINVDQFQAILLPGGDGPRMRPYLESEVLRTKVLQFYQRNKLVGAICHGVLVVARTINPLTGHSILYGHKVTVLPKLLDVTAYKLDKWLTRNGYIMYPQCVEDEVRPCLENPNDLSAGANFMKPYVVADGNLVTSRWYNDAELFALRFSEELEQRQRIDVYAS